MSQQRRDFWFWVLGTVAILVLFGSSLAYEFGLNAPWLPWIAGAVVLLATIATGALLYADRRSRRSAQAAAPEEQASREQGRKTESATALLLASMLVLGWLTDSGVIPRLLAATIAVVVFTSYTYFILVRDKSQA
jgi:hypothetical protein